MKSPRAAEYEAIARISHRLRSAAQHRDQDFPGYVAALNDNLRLWTTFAVDIAQADNALPKDLRARLFWLAEFTIAETRKLLRGDGDIAILIEVNAAILQGLRGSEERS
jgi:flagellar protein FlaF